MRIAAHIGPVLLRLRRAPQDTLHHMNPDDQLAAFDEGTLDLGLSRPLPPERRRYFEEAVVYTDNLAALLPPKQVLLRAPGSDGRTNLRSVSAVS